MTSIKTAAQEYETSAMQNISVLDSVSVDVDVKEETRENSAGESYKVNFIEVEGVKYRVPFTVIKNLKSILAKKPALKTFCVSRQGTTKDDTTYTVIPLD